MARIFSKKADKFSFQQQYPVYTTCSPTTLKFCSMDNETSSAVSKRSSSVVVPIKQFHDDNEQYEIPEIKSHHAGKGSSSSSKYWSWTFGITTFPFIVWGCPFYLLLTQRAPIRTTRTWLKCIFDCSNPILTVLNCILLIFTVLVNIYVISLFVTVINSLFIAGVYKSSVFHDLIDFLRDIPVVIPLNYVWLRGFKINNIVCLLNQKYRMYSQIACGGYRLRLLVMMLVVVCVHVIRYYSYKKYTFADWNFFTIWKTLWEFSVDIFVTLTFPVYCTFCYAIRFELSTIKAVVYETISKRVIPNISHLNKFKTLYTHAADHIDTVNNFCSQYLSITIVLTIIGTAVDAENLIISVSGLVVSVFSSIFGAAAGETFSAITNTIINETSNNMNQSLPLPKLPPFGSGGPPHQQLVFENNQTTINDAMDGSLDSVVVRQVNAEIVCIVLVYVLLLFTLWQAVATNDCAREVHVWLNDFVSGAGGTDVKVALMDLGVVDENDIVNNDSTGFESFIGPQREVHLLWGRNSILHNDHSDQFLEKFRMLKSYIHVRMQLEKPSLLYIALVGLFAPSLSGRLRRYNIMF